MPISEFVIEFGDAAPDSIVSTELIYVLDFLGVGGGSFENDFGDRTRRCFGRHLLLL
jgi:hypothetical protein